MATLWDNKEGGVGSENETGKSLSELLDQDIAHIRDLVVGTVKGKTTQAIGLAGDIGELKDSAIFALTGLDMRSPRDSGPPTSKEVEQAIGVYNPDPSGYEQAGSALDPAHLLKTAGAAGLAKLGIVVGRKIPVVGAHTADLNTQMMLADPKSWVADGKLKTELSDAGITLNVDNIGTFLADIRQRPFSEIQGMSKKDIEAYGYRELIPVEALMNHPGNLFEKYPELKDVHVTPDSSMSENEIGSFNPRTKTLKINPYSTQLKAYSKSADENNEAFISTVMHELQHAVQGIEGYASGGNWTQFLAGNTTPAAWGAIRERAIDRIKKARTEVGNAIGIEEPNEKDLARLKQSHPEVHQQYTDATNAARNLDRINHYMHAKYENLAGEVEARVTEQRLKMTQDEADAKPFLEHYEEELQKSAELVDKRFKTMRGY